MHFSIAFIHSQLLLNLTISKLFPHFRYETLDPQFISKCLTEDTNTPNELLVERFEDKLDWKDIIENDENF